MPEAFFWYLGGGGRHVKREDVIKGRITLTKTQSAFKQYQTTPETNTDHPESISPTQSARCTQGDPKTFLFVISLFKPHLNCRWIEIKSRDNWRSHCSSGPSSFPVFTRTFQNFLPTKETTSQLFDLLHNFVCHKLPQSTDRSALPNVMSCPH